MPVLRSTTKYRRHPGGPRKYIKLYAAWRNMNGRCRGTHHDGRGNYRWAGLPMEFDDWHHFRRWALANGYSRERCSLDRIDREKGYSPDNCQWLSKADNCRKAVTGRA